jgi:O-antigen/teichoic acid export membrane protein
VAWLSGMIGLGATRLLLAIRLFLRVGGREEGVVAEAIPDETDPVYFHQWVFLSLNGVLESFSANIDNLFLAWLLSGAAFAVYFIGSYEIPLTGLLVSVAGTFINVQIRKYYLEDDSILRMFHTVCLIQSFLLFPLFFFLQIHSVVLFDLFFHGKYGESVGIFLISSCILPFRIANYTAILQNKMKGRLIISGSILGMIAKLLLCLLLYRWAGVKGVAAAVVIGTVIQMGYYLYHSAILLGVRIYRVLPLKSLLLYFLASGIISLAEARLSSGLPVLQQLIAGAMTLLLLSGVPFYVYYRKIRRPNG